MRKRSPRELRHDWQKRSRWGLKDILICSLCGTWLGALGKIDKEAVCPKKDRRKRKKDRRH